MQCQCVSGQSVRYRASQLLAAVLAALGDEASLDDDLCDKLLLHQVTHSSGRYLNKPSTCYKVMKLTSNHLNEIDWRFFFQ